MNGERFHALLAVLVSVLTVLLSADTLSAAPSRALQIIDLGTLGGTESFAFAINDRGQAVGESRTAGDQETHMFLYDRGRLIDLSTLYNVGTGDFGEQANDINARGQIVGNIRNGDAALFSQGRVTDLNTSGWPFSTALGINNSGQIVGYYDSPYLVPHAFLYRNGRITSLGPSGSEATSTANAINDTGMVVGEASDSFSTPSHAFLYSNGVMADISPFGSSESHAYDINSRGQVVGTFLTADHTAFHAFLYDNGTFTDLGSPNSPESDAFAINNQGQIVGITFVPYQDVCFDPNTGENYPCIKYKQHAFVYENRRMIDLNSLLPPGSGWELVGAFDINNNGQIVGYGLVNGRFRAFIASHGSKN